jgi:glycosyltransferase involved in cell wall biosynthesis
MSSKPGMSLTCCESNQNEVVRFCFLKCKLKKANRLSKLLRPESTVWFMRKNANEPMMFKGSNSRRYFIRATTKAATRVAMKINICSGYSLDSPKGNTVTAKRIERLLRKAGYDATAMHTDSPPRADVQICLHAFKTAAASISFAEQCPDGRLFVFLTGTDLHGGVEQRPELANRVLDLAERLIVAQPACLSDLPSQWRSKTTVIYPSIELPDLPSVETPQVPLFTNVGHLREVKNPHLMYRALRTIPDPCCAVSLGVALERVEGQQALIHQRQDARYLWKSDFDRPTALAWMKRSIATINSSFSEGGANSVLEAIQLGVPVLASSIAGNRGFLGDDYGGYFDSDDADGLAKLMSRCLNDDAFIDSLKQQQAARQPLFATDSEIDAWNRLIDNRA